MVRVVLTEEQARVVRQAGGRVQFCDPAGNVLTAGEPELTAEQIADFKCRAAASGPRIPGHQVAEHLQQLEAAWQREGGFDKVRLHELLRELRSNGQA